MIRPARLSRLLRDSVVIVTGAASGMGEATAWAFADEGAKVAVCDINAARAQQLAAAIAASGAAAQAFTLDVASDASIQQLVADVVARFGGIDIVINNAGISVYCPIDAPDYDERWTQGVAVLLTGQQRLIRASLPHLRKAAHPRIVNIASTEALGATSGYSAYSAAKAGVTGLTRSLAVELGREGITVNCICPGPINTGMTSRISDEHKAVFAKRRTAIGRYGEPSEVAHMTLSVCLPAASYLTGAVIPVDGGLMARNA